MHNGRWLHIFCLIFFLASTALSQPAASITQTISASSDTLDSTLTKVIVGDIILIGNNITKPSILLRELTFHKGDTITLGAINEAIVHSEENLQNTSLFNSVRINWLQDHDKVNFYILVTERWYIFPVPVFEIAERNFNVWWETKDFSRVIYGGILNWNNFRGRNETVAATVRLGYIQRFSFYYNFPSISRNQKTGLTLSWAYSRNHQTAVKTIDNKIVYFKDPDNFSRKETGGSVVLSIRPHIHVTHYFEAAYRHVSVEDTVRKLNEIYLDAAAESKVTYSVLRYFLKVEHRDLAVYPSRGYYFDLELIKYGLPLFKEKVDIGYALSHIKYSIPLSKRWNIGLGLAGKYTIAGTMPYYFTKGLGYGRDFIRGYEYYVMDGAHFGLLKSNLRFTLLPKKELHAGFIPLNKFATIPYAFYLNLFTDAGYVKDEMTGEFNPLSNSWQHGYGAGIDFVTYYDMVFRLEYSFNKLGESGIFLHFTSSI